MAESMYHISHSRGIQDPCRTVCAVDVALIHVVSWSEEVLLRPAFDCLAGERSPGFLFLLVQQNITEELMISLRSQKYHATAQIRH